MTALVVIEDMGSSNGTFVNEPDARLTKPRLLLDGDMILAGELTFLFVCPEDE